MKVIGAGARREEKNYSAMKLGQHQSRGYESVITVVFNEKCLWLWRLADAGLVIEKLM